MDALLKAVELLKKGGDSGAKEKLKYKQCPVLLNASSYSLNKSWSKHVIVGLQSYAGFPIAIQIRGNKNDWVQFYEAEWRTFIENQGVLTNYFYSNDVQWSPLNFGRKTVFFQKIDATKVLRIQDCDGSEVYLGQESLEELWQLQKLLEFRVLTLKELNFEAFYASTIKRAAKEDGDYRSSIPLALESLKETAPRSAACMHEMLKYAGDIVMCDIELDHFVKFI